MPRSETRWYCSKCGRPAVDYDAARECETDHVLEPILTRFRQDLDRIFSRSEKIRARLKPQSQKPKT